MTEHSVTGQGAPRSRHGRRAGAPAAINLTGIGLYTLPEASRLTGAKVYSIRRWLFGYTHTHRDPTTGLVEARVSPPLWRSQLAGLGEQVIGFHDLLEVRFVRAFVDAGVDLRIVRAAASTAREILEQDYPFSTKRFMTDGKTIFYRAVGEGTAELLDLKRRQFAFDAIIKPSLYTGIEFRSDGSAQRWFPMANSKTIVIDPDIAFGKPILRDYGIPTAVLYEAFRAERKNRARVARLYEIPPGALEAAIRFEQRLAA